MINKLNPLRVFCQVVDNKWIEETKELLNTLEITFDYSNNKLQFQIESYYKWGIIDDYFSYKKIEYYKTANYSSHKNFDIIMNSKNRYSNIIEHEYENNNISMLGYLVYTVLLGETVKDTIFQNAYVSHYFPLCYDGFCECINISNICSSENLKNNIYKKYETLLRITVLHWFHLKPSMFDSLSEHYCTVLTRKWENKELDYFEILAYMNTLDETMYQHALNKDIDTNNFEKTFLSNLKTKELDNIF